MNYFCYYQKFTDRKNKLDLNLSSFSVSLIGFRDIDFNNLYYIFQTKHNRIIRGETENNIFFCSYLMNWTGIKRFINKITNNKKECHRCVFVCVHSNSGIHSVFGVAHSLMHKYHHNFFLVEYCHHCWTE